jgi:hypothetical protein
MPVYMYSIIKEPMVASCKTRFFFFSQQLDFSRCYDKLECSSQWMVGRRVLEMVGCESNRSTDGWLENRTSSGRLDG